MNSLYDKGRQAFTTGAINWIADDIRAVLVDGAGYTADLAAHEFLNAIPSGALVGSPVSLTGKSVSNGDVSAGSVAFTGLVSAPTVEQIVLYKWTGDESTSRLIAVIDTATGLPVPAGRTAVNVNWGARVFRFGRIPEPVLDTRPRWFAGPATAGTSGTEAYIDGATKFGSNGGKAGSNIVVSATAPNYGWYACVSTAGTPIFTHVASGLSGGWVNQGTHTDSDGVVWQLWRQDYPGASDTWTIT